MENMDWKKHNADSRKIQADILRDLRKHDRKAALELKKRGEALGKFIAYGYDPRYDL